MDWNSLTWGAAWWRSPKACRVCLRKGLEACRGADMVVAGLGGFFVGLSLAEKLGLPFVPAFLYPLTPTREFPGVLAPQGRIPTWANRLSHQVVQQMMWQTFRAADNKVRREMLGLAPLPMLGPFPSIEKKKQTILYGYSPFVIPVPKDWGDHNHVTGYWLLEPSSNWEAPADLLEFLESGPPPVYIGFGSMVHRSPEETTEMVLHALQRSGQRGLVSTGWGGLKKESLPEGVFMVGSLPHTWLFPRMVAVVHHGGVGTTAAGLWAGIPSVITPYFGDQPFWGQKVYELGVGPQPIPRKHLTEDRLTEAIRCAVSDAGMREEAARLGQSIRAEDGIKCAVEVLEKI
jgi:sterol 3beta-glucosyltransferase